MENEESLIPIEIKHKEFLAFTSEILKDKIKKKKRSRIIGYIYNEDVKMPVSLDEILIDAKLTLYPEAIPYLFQLEGCPKKLFLFLLLYRTKVRSHRVENEAKFKFNSSTISLFNQFCDIYPPVYGETSVKQAIKQLREQNIILSVGRGENLINPMITGGKNFRARCRLIQQYGEELVRQDKNPWECFYPKLSR